MSSAKFGWFIVSLCVVFSANAPGQTVPTKIQRPAQIAQTADEVGGGPRWFQLDWPILVRPLTFSVSSTVVPTYEMLRWPTYDWEMLLWKKDSIGLHLFNRVLPAIELNCTKGACQPMLESTLGLEGRLNLGGRGALPDNYLLMRREIVQEPVNGSYRRLKFGLGGALDL